MNPPVRLTRLSILVYYFILCILLSHINFRPINSNETPFELGAVMEDTFYQLYVRATFFSDLIGEWETLGESNMFVLSITHGPMLKLTKGMPPPHLLCRLDQISA